MTPPPLQTPRDKIARALVTVLWDEESRGGRLPVPFDNLCESNRAMLYRGADACLAVLAKMEVSEEAILRMLTVLDERGWSPQARHGWWNEANDALAAGFRAMLGLDTKTKPGEGDA